MPEPEEGFYANGPDVRPETGVMRFADDWPGVFIRGDNAYHYGITLEAAIQAAPTIDAWGELAELARLLKSCDTRLAPAAQRATLTPHNADSEAAP